MDCFGANASRNDRFSPAPEKQESSATIISFALLFSHALRDFSIDDFVAFSSVRNSVFLFLNPLQYSFTSFASS